MVCLYARLAQRLDRFLIVKAIVHSIQQGEDPSGHYYCENFREVLVTPLIASMTRPAPPFATLVGLTIGRLAGRDWRLGPGRGNILMCPALSLGRGARLLRPARLLKLFPDNWAD